MTKAAVPWPEHAKKMSATAIHHKSKNKKAGQVHYMAQDWPDNMKISKEAFEEYAARVEQDDFEDDVRGLSSSLHQLVGARRDTIKKLRASAEYLDSVWIRCRITKSVGTSASVVGGSLTIAGGILTLTTAGLAAPLLIAGIATSSVGAATNIGTSLVEKIINSKQVKEMSEALYRDKELTLKIAGQIEDMRRYRESNHLESHLDMVHRLLGEHHVVMVILKSVYFNTQSGPEPVKISSKFLCEKVHETIASISYEAQNNNVVDTSAAAVEEKDADADTTKAEEESKPDDEEDGIKNLENGHDTNENNEEEPMVVATNDDNNAEGENSDSATAAGAAVAATAGVAAAATAAAATNGKGATTAAAKEGLKYNPLGPDVFLETGKVVGQNSTRMAGQVIVGVSAAFLVWDAIDLGWTVTDLIRKKGSNAGKILTEKADELEEALKETIENYSVDMVRD